MAAPGLRRGHQAAGVGLAACAALLFGSTAAASPLFELVGAGRTLGGFNARVTGAGAASAYFNPALLPHAEPGVDVGLVVLAEAIDIRVDPRAGASQCASATACDVPVVFNGGPESFRHASGEPLANPTLPTAWLEQGDASKNLAARPRQAAGSGENAHAYTVVGLVRPLFADRVALGLYLMAPLGDITRAHAFYNDEREQFFSNSLHPELYADRLTATSLAFGVGGKLTDQLSVGVSATVALKNSAAAPVYISNLSDLDTVLLSSDVQVKAALSPHFGATYRPRRDLFVAATVHTPQSLKITTGFEYLIATGVEQSAQIDFTHAYMPLTAAVGAAWWVRDDLALAATAVGARWSQYVDRHSERPHPAYAWRDTVATSVGLRHTRGALAGFVDATYQPTAVPAQTGRSNYVDNNRLALASGLAYQFTLWGSPFRAGLELQGHRLLDRHVSKAVTPANPQPNPNLPGHIDLSEFVIDEVPDDAVDTQFGDPIPGREGLQTNNPGFPGFASQGWIWGGGVHLTLLY
jgi:long-chain fatty acid transport protein